MIRRLTVSILPVVLGSVALLASFADVTFVMKNGERISGRSATTTRITTN